MQWCYGFIKEKDRLILSEIYFDDNNEIQGACDNFDEDEQLNFDQILEDLQEANCYFEYKKDKLIKIKFMEKK